LVYYKALFCGDKFKHCSPTIRAFGLNIRPTVLGDPFFIVAIRNIFLGTTLYAVKYHFVLTPLRGQELNIVLNITHARYKFQGFGGNLLLGDFDKSLLMTHVFVMDERKKCQVLRLK